MELKFDDYKYDIDMSLEQAINILNKECHFIDKNVTLENANKIIAIKTVLQELDKLRYKVDGTWHKTL